MRSPTDPYARLAWLILFVCIGASALWYSAHAALEVYRWQGMSSSVKALSQEWTIHPAKRWGYQLEVHYQFSLQDQNFHGKQRLEQNYFRNKWAAEEKIKALKSKDLVIWYTPDKPLQSTPFRHFPYRLCGYAIVLTLLTLYFAGLRLYLLRQEQK